MSNRVSLEERNVVFQNRLQTFALVNNEHIDIREFFDDAFILFLKRIKSILDEHFIIKIAACFCAIFQKTVATEEGEKKETQTIYLHTRSEIVDFETDLTEHYEQNIVQFVLKKIDDIQLQGSGFSLSEIKDLNVQVGSFEPYAGSTFIDLPKELKNKRAIINVRNDDNKCFMYAVLSALYPVKEHAQRTGQYKQFENTLNFTGIKFPVELKEITKFELQNLNISINVYMYDEEVKSVRPLRLSKEVKEKHIHLLLLSNHSDDEHYEKSHYCWIKNLSALLGRQISANSGKLYFCDRCLNHFRSDSKLQAHKVCCFKQNDCQIEMPGCDENIIEFKNYNKQLKVPFIIYADVESILKKPDIQFSKSENTVAYQQHEAYSVGYYFKCTYDDTKCFYKSKRGPTCIDWFVQELNDIATQVDSILNKEIPMNMTSEDEAIFITSEKCIICGKKFLETEVRVRDHSHLTGKFRGAAHADCNLNYKEPRYVPIVFHNLSNYDAHFIVKQFAANIPGDITIIPRNDQLYISFTKTVKSVHSASYKNFIKLRFIDSFRFMSSSLDYLASLLPPEKKKNLRFECRDLSIEQIKLLERKGVFCYDYIDSWSKLDENSLPSKDDFYSSLTESPVSNDDYEFAKLVWEKFNINTIGEYSDLYMKTDILLLADIFENFRDTCYEHYKLDPAHYYTAPGLSFDAMLKYTQVKIELLTDIDMLLFVERGIRGGISQCSKRYCKANNKYMTEYNPNVEAKFLIYLDANNLYGYSMMQHLPLDSFQWCDEEFSVEKILNISDSSAVGYIFEVDLDYPEYLHDKHKDYPFCCENQAVPHTKNDKKLLLTLYNKKNYVIHYKMLKCALQQGLILKRIHKVLKFTQSEWLKPYIMLNTLLRTKALNEFEKNFYKLLINAIYGKTMENVRARVDIKLKSKWEGRYGARKLVALPNFKKYTYFDEDLISIELNKTTIVMNKPIAIGMAILDISKVLMYDFYYNHLKFEYGEDVELAYSDTDSFILEIKTQCFYTDMKNHLHKYDTSDYTDGNIYNIPRKNKKIPGLFKDELNGVIMTEFVGLRSKMYSVKADGIEKMKKAKGVKKYVLKKTITFDDYVDCIKNNCSVIRNQNSFRSKNHTVFSVKQVKVALNPFDNKRFILEDNICTLPWGHYALKEFLDSPSK